MRNGSLLAIAEIDKDDMQYGSITVGMDEIVERSSPAGRCQA